MIADIELCHGRPASTARACTRRSSRSASSTTPTGWATWSGASSPTGAAAASARCTTTSSPTATYITQWLEELERDYSHPSIVGWCPLNETWQALTDRITDLDDVTRGMFLATKAMDRTRPVLDASGYSHRVPEADVYDCHDYEQDPAKFAANHAGTRLGKPYRQPRLAE